MQRFEKTLFNLLYFNFYLYPITIAPLMFNVGKIYLLQFFIVNYGFYDIPQEVLFRNRNVLNLYF